MLAEIERGHGPLRRGARSTPQQSLDLARRTETPVFGPYARAALGAIAAGEDDADTAIAEYERARRDVVAIGVPAPGELFWTVELVELHVRAGRRRQGQGRGRAPRGARHARPPAGRTRRSSRAAARSSPTATRRRSSSTRRWRGTPRRRRRSSARAPSSRSASACAAAARAPTRARRCAPRWRRSSASARAGGPSARAPSCARRGATSARGEQPVAEVLTPHELQVAMIVARGATNKEAAAALFVSPKTVEHHLGQIYRKLDLRSRTELTALLSGQVESAVGVGARRRAGPGKRGSRSSRAQARCARCVPSARVRVTPASRRTRKWCERVALLTPSSNVAARPLGLGVGERAHDLQADGVAERLQHGRSARSRRCRVPSSSATGRAYPMVDASNLARGSTDAELRTVAHRRARAGARCSRSPPTALDRGRRGPPHRDPLRRSRRRSSSRCWRAFEGARVAALRRALAATSATLGTAGFAGFNLLSFAALEHISPEQAALVVATTPLLTLLVPLGAARRAADRASSSAASSPRSPAWRSSSPRATRRLDHRRRPRHRPSHGPRCGVICWVALHRSAPRELPDVVAAALHAR